ncbi:hypothetical protein ACN47E_004433 [Coniothyrium glycines]
MRKYNCASRSVHGTCWPDNRTSGRRRVADCPNVDDLSEPDATEEERDDRESAANESRTAGLAGEQSRDHEPPFTEVQRADDAVEGARDDDHASQEASGIEAMEFKVKKRHRRRRRHQSRPRNRGKGKIVVKSRSKHSSPCLALSCLALFRLALRVLNDTQEKKSKTATTTRLSKRAW